MRICFFGSFNGGGTERATFLVANELAKENDVFVLNSKQQLATYPLNGIEMDQLNRGNVLARNISLLKYLRRNKIDIIVSVEALSGIFSIIPAKIVSCKNIIWEHANYFQTQGSKNTQRIRKLELLIAEAYIVLTKRDYNNFQRNFRIKTKFEQIYNIADAKCESIYNPNAKTIISVGHINNNKNFIIIPDIAKCVFEKHPDWKWLIYGEKEGEYFETLMQKVVEYGLTDNIIFPGFVNDVQAIYNDVAIYVMTSYFEGFPMVLLEAKAHSIPIVSFDIETGPDEIVQDGINGYIIRNRDIEQMTERIIELVDNQSKRCSFSRESKIGLSDFSCERIIQEWKSVLYSLA